MQDPPTTDMVRAQVRCPTEPSKASETEASWELHIPPTRLQLIPSLWHHGMFHVLHAQKSSPGVFLRSRSIRFTMYWPALFD